MKHITIPQTDQYQLNDVNVFKIEVKENDSVATIYRDIYIELNKNIKPILEILAREIGIKNYRKMKKSELINTIKEYISF